MKTILEIRFYATEDEGLNIIEHSFSEFKRNCDTFIGNGLTIYQCKSWFNYISEKGMWTIRFGEGCQESAEYVLVGISQLDLEENQISLISVSAWNKDGEFENYSPYCEEVEQFGCFTFNQRLLAQKK